MPETLIALGSNLGDRRRALDRAVARLGELPDTRMVARSRLYETAPVGGPPGQGLFLNGAVLLDTSLAPAALLDQLGRIERELGRQPAERWAPRPIDLDLLLYGGLVLETAELVLPHPRMAWRRFVLEPAAEIAPQMVHPTIGWSTKRLLQNLNTTPAYVALTGPFGAGKTALAQQLVERTGADLIAGAVSPPLLEGFYANPAGMAWDLELQFVDERTRLLAADLRQWSNQGGLWISDFWFDQSLAYGRVWLPDERTEQLRQTWQSARNRVVSPRLIVLVDPPIDRLLAQVRQHGRPGEDRLDSEVFERMRHEIRAEATSPGRGPVLRLADAGCEPSLAEVLAAIQAMK